MGLREDEGSGQVLSLCDPCLPLMPTVATAGVEGRVAWTARRVALTPPLPKCHVLRSPELLLDAPQPPAGLVAAEHTQLFVCYLVCWFANRSCSWILAQGKLR